jgi:hypothetical protein
MKRQGSVVGGIPAGRGDLEEKDQIITNAIQVPAPKDRLLIHTFACSSSLCFRSYHSGHTRAPPFGAGVDRSCGGRKWDERFPHAGGAGVAARER